MTAASRFVVTLFPDLYAQEKHEQKVTTAELASWIETTTAPSKNDLPWIKLAAFGDVSTDSGSFRHDRNVRFISGVEGDYDGELMPFVDAFDALDCAGISSILYTSPSHTEEKPRWRVLCPFSLGQQPELRRKFLARVNGVLGGVLSHELWTLSQSYYAGSVNSNPAHRVATIDGTPLDLMDALDAGAVGPRGAPKSANGHLQVSGDAREDGELVRRIVSGEGFHPELCALAARYVGRGVRSGVVEQLLQSLMLSIGEDLRDDRWHHRFGQIRGLVDSAATKFNAQVEARRCIARVTYQSMRFGTEDSIRAAVTAEAARIGVPLDEALSLAAVILDSKTEEYRVRQAGR